MLRLVQHFLEANIHVGLTIVLNNVDMSHVDCLPPKKQFCVKPKSTLQYVKFDWSGIWTRLDWPLWMPLVRIICEICKGYKRDKMSRRCTLIECFDVVLIVGWLCSNCHQLIHSTKGLIQTSNFIPSRSVTKICIFVQHNEEFIYILRCLLRT
jgi:hypothetical protein